MDSDWDDEFDWFNARSNDLNNNPNMACQILKMNIQKTKPKPMGIFYLEEGRQGIYSEL